MASTKTASKKSAAPKKAAAKKSSSKAVATTKKAPEKKAPEPRSIQESAEIKQQANEALAIPNDYKDTNPSENNPDVASAQLTDAAQKFRDEQVQKGLL